MRESFTTRERVVVTPLRPSRAPELMLEYSAGSYYRPYRDNDELRVAHCTLKHKSSGRTLELGALLVRREHRDSDTVLLTNGLELGLEGRALADLYNRCWPVQENAFKEGVGAGLDQHRGNCGRMVANVAVVTEFEKITSRLAKTRGKLAELEQERKELKVAAAETAQQERRAQKALATRRRWLDVLVAAAKTVGETFARVAVDHQQALVHAEEESAAASKARTAYEVNQTQSAKLERRCFSLPRDR